MAIPYDIYTEIDAPVIVNKVLEHGENLQLTLIAGDPDGDILNLSVSGCPTALQPNLTVHNITYSDIPVDLLNSNYTWLQEQPNTKFIKYIYDIVGDSSAPGEHNILFKVVDGRGGENWAAMCIVILEENSAPYLHGCIVAEEE